MAKKRPANSLKKIEQGMETLFNGASRLIESPPPNLEGMASRVYLAGDKIMDGLWQKGIDCKCAPTTAGGWKGAGSVKYNCTCKLKRKGQRRR